MKSVRIFKLLVFTAVLVFPQKNNMIINTLDSNLVSSKLEESLDNDSRLSIRFQLSSFNIDSNKILYNVIDQKKMVDTLIFSDNQGIKADILQKIFKPYLLFPIDQNLDKIGNNLVTKYSFFYESPEYELGLINEDTLAALINFNPVFKSHYAGMVATDNFNNNLRVNGQFNLRLENYFKGAEYFELFWSRIDSNSQQIKFEGLSPHPLGLGMGVFMRYDYELFMGLFTKVEQKFRLRSNSRLFTDIGAGFVRGFNQPTNRGLQLGYNRLDFYAYTMHISRDLTNKKFLPDRGSELSFDLDSGLDEEDYFVNGKFHYERFHSINRSFFFHYQFDFEGIKYFNSSVPKTRYKWYGGASSLRGYNEDLFKSTQYQISSLSFCFTPYERFQIKLFTDIGSDCINLYEGGKVGYGFGLAQVNQNSFVVVEYGLSDRYFSNGKLHLKWIATL